MRKGTAWAIPLLLTTHALGSAQEPPTTSAEPPLLSSPIAPAAKLRPPTAIPGTWRPAPVVAPTEANLAMLDVILTAFTPPQPTTGTTGSSPVTREVGT